jgi:hypothetical protein
MAEFQKVYEHILKDPAFREALVANPKHALETLGVEATPEVLAAIHQVTKSVQNLQAALPGDEAFVT